MMTKRVYLLDGNGKRVGFSYSQAEAILRGEAKMKHGVWVLPDDSPYEFKDNGFISRASKRDNKGKAARSTTGESTQARESSKDALRTDTSED
jgi:hypothetical protein